MGFELVQYKGDFKKKNNDFDRCFFFEIHTLEFFGSLVSIYFRPQQASSIPRTFCKILVLLNLQLSIQKMLSFVIKKIYWMHILANRAK